MGNLLEILSHFKERKAVVAGDVFLDQYIRGNIERLNPENPAVPLIKVKGIDYRLGGAANVARNLVSLGATCYLFGQIGGDKYGKKIIELCAKEGIETCIASSSRETIVKQRIFSDGHYIARTDFGEDMLDPISPEPKKYLEGKITSSLDFCDLVIFSDYDKGIFGSGLAERVIKSCNSKRRILTIADPKPANISAFRDCDIIRPNRKEAEEIVGIKYDGSNLRDIAIGLAEKVQPGYVVITCGEEGAFIHDVGKNSFNMIPTKKVEIADSIGAGDTFAAVLGLSMISGLDFEGSVKLANYSSAIVVGKVGTSVTNIEELRNSLNEI